MKNSAKSVYTPEEIRDMILGLEHPVELKGGQKVPAVNLDNGATTPPFKKVVEEITSQLMLYGSIGRGMGQKSAHSSANYTNGRKIVKDFVGVKDNNEYEVIYVNCTTDGMNKLASALIESPDDIVLTTRMEHHANDLPWRERCKTIYVDVDSKGRLIFEDIEQILKEHNGKIKYVSVTAASNVTGYINDVHEIARLAHQYGAKIIVDGAQIVAHREFNMLGSAPEENIDFFVFSAHKMYSPFGGGAIIGLTEELNKHIPHFYGGGMVDAVYDKTVFYSEAPDLFEAGSPNYPGVVGMLKSMEILKDIGFKYIEAHEQKLLKYAIEKMGSIDGVRLYGDNEKYDDRVGVIIFTLDGIKNQMVARQLADLSAVAVRHAAFCAHPYVRRLTNTPPLDIEPTEEPALIEGLVRASFGIYTTEAEIDILAKTIKYILDNKTALLSKNSDRVFMADSFKRPNDRG